MQYSFSKKFEVCYFINSQMFLSSKQNAVLKIKAFSTKDLEIMNFLMRLPLLCPVTKSWIL